MTSTENHCDVAIIGGGPAGSTAASALADKGWKVTVFEKVQHPRFHIGESLLPMNLPIFEQLGVMDKVKALGVYKPGAEFFDANYGDAPSTFSFGDAIDRSYPHAYQVRRGDFDEMLLRNSQRKGAEVLEMTRVLDVDWDSPECARLQVRSADGQDCQWTARYVIDASGRDTFMAKKLSIKARNPRHASAALFGHFRQVPRNEGENAGLITVYWFDHGWFWMIPLPDDVMSVGAVCDPNYLKQRKVSPEEFLQQTIAMAPEGMRKRMAKAELVGKVQATGNYSYRCAHMSGDGYIMIGDAFAFVDPVFSSGVLLGMHSGLRGAEYVDAVLRGAPEAAARKREFERLTRHGVKTFSWMIDRFNSPAMKRLFMVPGNPWRVRDAVVSLLCGDVFRSNGVMWRFNIFKALYYGWCLRHPGAMLADYRRRRARARSEFVGGTLEQDAA